MTESTPRSARIFRFFRCLIVFAVCYILFQLLYRSVPDGLDVSMNHYLNAAPAAWLLDLFMSGTDIMSRDAMIVGAEASVNIRKGCEGFEVMGIVVAAMLAYPMAWRLRLTGLAVGIVYVYLLNLLRIIGIYLTHVFKPEWAEAAHVTAGQTFIILLVVVYLFFWIEWVVSDATSGAGKDGHEAGG